MTAESRWPEERIWRWWNDLGPIKGVNYIPRNAVNSIDFWLAETFDPDLIAEELQWARQAGYNALRVQLQYVVWANDEDGFMDRLDTFLGLAQDQGLRVVPVLFDDLDRAGEPPVFGPQPPPAPNRHNSRWKPSPGAASVVDRSQWPSLESYIDAVVGAHRRDDRILFWDLYNATGYNELGEQSLPLMEQTFDWVRAHQTRQPLAIASWDRLDSAMTARKWERSDLITFQQFDDPAQVEAQLALLQHYGRPIVCVDWLKRQQNNTFETILPLFAQQRVGWFSRGLVQGKTQFYVQDEAFRSATEPDVWQQDVLQPDGAPYRPEEIELIQGFRYAD